MGAGGEGSKAKVVEELLREFHLSILGELKSEVDEARRYLRFLAWLNTYLEGRGIGRVVITGGFAVEVYTARTYRTMDVDIIVEGVQAVKVVEEFLERISERVGRGFLPLVEVISSKSLDVVSTVYDRCMEPVKLLVDERYIYLEPPEELLVRYLAAWKYWNSTEDRDKALWLYYIWGERMNLNYVAEGARREGVEDKLTELQQLIETYLKHS